MWTGKWQGASTGAEPEEFSDALGGALNDYPCGGFSSLWYWLNTTEVRQALHVADNAYFFTGDNGVGFNYTSTEANLMPFCEFYVCDLPETCLH